MNANGSRGKKRSVPLYHLSQQKKACGAGQVIEGMKDRSWREKGKGPRGSKKGGEKGPTIFSLKRGG